MIFDQNGKNGLHLDRQKAYDLELRKIRVKSEGLLPMVGEKRLKRKRRNFFRRVRRFCIKVLSVFANQHVFQSY